VIVEKVRKATLIVSG